MPMRRISLCFRGIAESSVVYQLPGTACVFTSSPDSAKAFSYCLVIVTSSISASRASPFTRICFLLSVFRRHAVAVFHAMLLIARPVHYLRREHVGISGTPSRARDFPECRVAAAAAHARTISRFLVDTYAPTARASKKSRPSLTTRSTIPFIIFAGRPRSKTPPERLHAARYS